MSKPKQRSIDGFPMPRSGTFSERKTPINNTPTIEAAPASNKAESVKVASATFSSEVHLAANKLVSQQFYYAKPNYSQPQPTHRSRFHRPTKRQVKWTIICLVFILLMCGGIFAWKAFASASKVFKGNILNGLTSIVAPDKPLAVDQYGNTTILLFGTSESDPNHPGAQLTDAMMIASVNQITHKAFLLSIPRDLWVKGGSMCVAGYEYKINAVYECNLSTSLGGLSNMKTADEAAAEAATANKVQSVTGVNINYVVHMNLTVIQKVVDAIGGVDITIDSPDPRGILDRNFDWRCSYKCYLVKYPNGLVHLSGTDAMWLAQARNDSGGYGLPRSNFDREANQRKIFTATKDKATSIGFLSNPLNSLNLLDALGTNVHTNIDSSLIKTFIDVVKALPSNNITSIDIQGDGSGILTTGTGPDGSSIVNPVAGLYDYSAIQTFTTSLLMGAAPLIHEAAPIDIVNATGVSGAASQAGKTLEQKGFAIGRVSSAPSAYSNTTQYTIYDLSKGAKPDTLTALQTQLGVTAIQTALPTGITSSSPFIVVLGNTSSTKQ